MAPVTSTAPAPDTAAPVAGAGKVSVQYTADCWTQVTDGTGKVLFGGLKRKGENLEVSGKPPLSLRLGYARGAQVSYNGQPVDVAPFTSAFMGLEARESNAFAVGSWNWMGRARFAVRELGIQCAERYLKTQRRRAVFSRSSCVSPAVRTAPRAGTWGSDGVVAGGMSSCGA